MKRTIKKVVATVLATGMLLSMSTFSVLAAGNYTDTYFSNFTITAVTIHNGKTEIGCNISNSKTVESRLPGCCPCLRRKIINRNKI